jgi:U4/U6 small nuclear ribonucleoprotein PRP3
MNFSSKEIEEIRPELKNISTKVLGSVDDRVVSIFERGIYNGYDKEKLVNKLSTIVEEKKAFKLTDKFDQIMDFYRDSKPKKRQFDDEEMKDIKKMKTTHEESAPPADGPLTSVQIKKMMEAAQRQIEERKKKLESMKIGSGNSESVLDMAQDERQRKIAELKMQIQAKISGNLGLSNPPVSATASALIPKPTDKPRPLILDEEGRTVDISGREINIQTLTPTLKANIRAKKKETFKTQQVEKAVEEAKTAESAFYDERLMVKTAVRGKRALRFHEPGKFQMMAERMRMKAQYEKLQNEISQIARKTGISSATKLALIAPKTDVHNEEIPKYEWWDSVILTEDLNKIVDGKISIREQAITNLIEHPIQAFPPNESIRPVFLPVFLTKKEQKKLRRQNRREAWKEEQEKIRLGLIDPPEPKLKLMYVNKWQNVNKITKKQIKLKNLPMNKDVRRR